MTTEEKLKRHNYLFNKVDCYDEKIIDIKTPEELEEMYQLREELQQLGLLDDRGCVIEMTVKDLKYKDIIELWYDANFRVVLSDEFCAYEDENKFVTDEDSDYHDFNEITRIWREDKNGNYILIYTQKGLI